MLPYPQIDLDRCDGCQRCIDVCPTGALGLKNGRAHLTHPEKCTYCISCEDICPQDAIALPFLVVLAAQNSSDDER